MSRPMSRVGACLGRAAAVLSLALPLLAAAVPADGGPTVRLIVKLRPEASAASAAAGSARDVDRLGRLATRRGLALQPRRALGQGLQLVTVQGLTAAEAAARLSADGEVAYAAVDRRVRRAAVPNDTLYSTGGANGPVVGQWYLRPPDATAPAAIDAQTAWDTTTGSSSVVVAVLDTGVRFDHPDLGRVTQGGKLLPGYDFIASFHDDNNEVSNAVANDGNGVDADPSDPGDAVTTAEVNAVGGPFYHCTPPKPDGSYSGESSSWHGTQVAGIVGALTNNANGIAGVGWNTQLLPVRVLGKCGGYESDIAAAMRWAAGIHVDGVPDNATPAKVINLSLGSDAECSPLIDDTGKRDTTYQDVIDAVVARGVTVVVAAGNGTGHALGAPANCDGVIAVTGLRHVGTKVGYSDLGPEAAIAAPAGNCINTTGPCLYAIVTTTNTGTSTPAASTYSDALNASLGTSFSAPMVSGTVALMLAVQPALTPAQIKAKLQASARPFPTTGGSAGIPQCTAPTSDAGGNPVDQDECYCTTGTCGAGMLDAKASVLSALSVLARIAVATAAPTAGQPVTVDASGSLFGSGRNAVSYAWTVADGGGIVTGFDGAANGVTASFTASAAGTVTVSVTVTDNLGAASTVSQQVAVAAAPVSAGGGTATTPVASSGGGGGGGALSGGFLVALALAVWVAWRVAGRHGRLPAVLLVLLAGGAAHDAARALPAAGTDADRPAHGLIVQLKPQGDAGDADARWGRLLDANGLAQRGWRPHGRAGRLVAADGVLTAPQARELAQRLRADPAVAWVEPNVRERRLDAAVVPNDPGFADQWWLKPVSGSNANALADRLRGVPGVQSGWATSTGDPARVIAVLDTGITVHPELAGRVIAGYDFVSDVEYANDGDGRDADPSDPGDWVEAADQSRDPALFKDCPVSDSSWHGSIVAGQLVALTDNGDGVAALQWGGQVLAVRVAGKCGATVADIIDGMRWAAGLAVVGAPVNPHPARIVNVSFGGDAACSQAYQSAIDELATVGALVVAAAGNDHAAVSRPANCRGVLGVGAVNRDGFKATYSNFGSELALSTVGGDYKGDGAWGALVADSGLLTIDNDGLKGPGSPRYAYVYGTSFSAPLVSGAAGLMLAVNPQLTVAQLLDGLERSARPHVTSPVIGQCSATNPGRCICTTSTCGAGLLDVPEALRYAADPAGYAPLARTGEVIDNADVRSAVALGADLPANAAGSGGGTTTPSAPSENTGSGGGALGIGWLLALVVATAAATRTAGRSTSRR